MSIWLIRRRLYVGRWLRNLLLPGSAVIGLIGVAYAVLQLLKSEGVASEEAWSAGQPLGALLLGTGIAALVGGALVFIGYGRLLKRLNRNDALAEACQGIWYIVVRGLEVEMNKLTAPAGVA